MDAINRPTPEETVTQTLSKPAAPNTAPNTATAATPKPVSAPIPPSTPPRLLASFDRFDLIFGVLFLLLSLLAIDFVFYGSFSLGFSVVSIVTALTMAAYLLRSHKPTLVGGFFFICALVIAGTFTFYDSAFGKVCLFFAFWILLAAAILDVTGHTGNTLGDWREVRLMLRYMIATPFARIGSLFGSLKVGNAKQAEKGKRVGAVLVGVLCAVPALLIILPLLMASDAAFEALIDQLFSFDISRSVQTLIWGSLLFLLVFSALFAASKKIILSPDAVEKKSNGMSAIGVNSFLSAIGIVYAVYLLSQFGYFFGGFLGVTPEEFSVAEYARRGFFEMTVICAINLLIVGIVLRHTRRTEQGKTPRSTKGLCLFIIAFSLAVIATVFAKLGLYMSRFGLTHLRVYTTLFCALLAIIFIGLIIRLFVEKFPYFRIFLVIAATLAVTVALADVDTTIAHYNYTAYRDGRLTSLDVYHLTQLDSAGVPYLIELLDDTQYQRDAAHLLSSLAGRHPYGTIDPNGQFIPRTNIDFRDYNVSHARSRDLIAEHWGTIQQLDW